MAKEQKSKGGKVKVRVLVDCEVGKCNTAAEIEQSELAGLEGKVDSSPEAVAYVERETKG